MDLTTWIGHNWIEIFGAVTGIVYVFLEIRQKLWLWPVGFVTSAVYVWVFFHGKLYADMSLQVYYLVISVAGWYWWVKGTRYKVKGIRKKEQVTKDRESPPGIACPDSSGGGGGSIVEVEFIDEPGNELIVSRIKFKLALILTIVFAGLYAMMFFILYRFTDSPVPGFDAFLTSMSIIATWMLARKIYEHWFLWIIVNSAACGLFIFRGLYPTVLLYAIYCIMSFAGLIEWKKSLAEYQRQEQVT